MLNLRLRRVGSSLGVLLPKAQLDDLGLKEGDTVVVPRLARRGPQDLYGIWRETPVRFEFEED